MNSWHISKIGRRRPIRTHRLLIIAATAILSLLVSSGIVVATDDLCFNYTNPSPTIDGVTTGDGGWRMSNQYVFQNGSGSPHAIVQMARRASYVYLSFEVNNDPTFDSFDTVLITLSPDGVAANDHRILIHPVATNAGNATSAPGGDPAEVKYWTDSSNWNSSGNITLPSWLDSASDNIKVTSSVDPDPATADDLLSYVVEMRIPISSTPGAGIDLPTGSNIGLYFNIIRVDTSPGADPDALGELRWPPEAPEIGGSAPNAIAVETHTPSPADWGNARVQDDCLGVKVYSIRTNHPSDSNGIDPNSTNNRFLVSVTNTGSQDANGVTATIKSWRFGNGSIYDYQPLPLPTPHINFGTVTAGQTTSELQTAPWDVLNDPNRPTYLTWLNVCSFVEVNATGGLIANRYGYWNLHFATASRFEHVAALGSKNFKPPTSDIRRQRYDIFVDTQQGELRRAELEHVAKELKLSTERESRGILLGTDYRLNRTDASRIAHGRVLSTYFPELLKRLKKDDVISIERLVFHTYVDTGRYIEIDGRRFRLKDNANSFGYILYHPGAVIAWKHVLRSDKLERVREASNRYVADVGLGEIAALTTIVEAFDVPCGWLEFRCLFSRWEQRTWTVAVAIVVFVGVGIFWAWRRRAS